MKPLEFSEFSYGYALTDSLRHTIPGGFGAAPILPSLRDEGKPDRGYDISIPIIGGPLLLQFKVPQVLRNRSKWLPPGFCLPYYRMHLRPYKHSNQHKMLMALETAKNLVYYVCPRFHLISDLNQYFINHQVSAESVYISPLGIGNLPDPKEHYVAFEPSANYGWRYSEEPGKKIKIGPESFVESVRNAVRNIETKDATRAAFEAIFEKMVHIIESSFEPKSLDLGIPGLKDQPIRVAGCLARLYFDSELFVIGTRTDER